ncbi:MAG: VOC family protein [Saprospiraceae bacterium]|nr:VOC family protein [Saprospiraceae bacterium]
MIKANCLDHINMHVLDVPASVAWYSSLFGFKVYEPLDFKPSAYCIIGNENIKLCMFQAPKINRFYNGLEHFGFHVEDYYETVEHLASLEIMIDSEMEWEYSKSLYVIDPSGYRVELSMEKGGGYDLPEHVKSKKLKQYFCTAQIVKSEEGCQKFDLDFDF